MYVSGEIACVFDIFKEGFRIIKDYLIINKGIFGSFEYRKI